MQMERSKLIEVLSMVKSGLAGTAIVEQATHFVFTGSQILTYNDRICICHPFQTDFQGSVPSDEFYKILNQMAGESVELNKRGDKLEFSCGKLKAGLVVFPEGDVISLVETLDIPDVKSKKWKPLPGNFMEAVSFCLFSAASNDSGPGRVLASVFVDDDRIVSSDNLRISIYSLKSGLGCSFLFPISSVYEFVKMGDMKMFVLGKSWIYFKSVDDVIFASRLLQGTEYPQVDDHFEFDYTEVVFPEDLKDSIEAVMVLAPGEMEINKFIDVVIEEGKVKCRGEKEVGWIQSEHEIDYSGPVIQFGINPVFFIQILKQTSLMRYGKGKALFVSDYFEHLLSLVVLS